MKQNQRKVSREIAQGIWYTKKEQEEVETPKISNFWHQTHKSGLEFSCSNSMAHQPVSRKPKIGRYILIKKL